MERGDQASLPTLQTTAPAQAEGHWPWQQQTPQAPLAPAAHGPQAKMDTDSTPRPTTSSTEKYVSDDGTTSGEESSPRREKSDLYGRTGGITIAPPPRARSVRDGAVYRPGETVMSPTRRRGSGLDWIVPEVDGGDKPYVPRLRSVGERLQPTLDHAHREKAKFEKKAMLNGWALNLAIGLQVVLGALITGLAAAIKPSKVGVTTSALGGISTLTASFLARMRGSKEPELSITRTKDLDQFIRECDAFQLDRGHITGNEEDAKLDELRKRFEELLGNLNQIPNQNGDQKKLPA